MTFSRDLVAGVIILALSAYLWFLTTTFDTDPLGMAQGMPATHMPQLILSLIVGLTILMMIQSLLKGGESISGLPPWQMMATVALLGLGAVSFTTVGLPIIFSAVCLLLPMLWGARNFGLIGAFAVAVPVAIYVIFKLLLGLRLPMGPLAALGL